MDGYTRQIAYKSIGWKNIKNEVWMLLMIMSACFIYQQRTGFQGPFGFFNVLILESCVVKFFISVAFLEFFHYYSNIRELNLNDVLYQKLQSFTGSVGEQQSIILSSVKKQ